MKKFSTFALLVCLLVIGVVAVISIQYPALQAQFADTGKTALDQMGLLFKKLVEAFQIAFSK